MRLGEMMEHLNYCRQLAMQCKQSLAWPNLTEEKAHMFRHIVALSAASQKFILPANGRVLNDMELRALEGVEELRLPHPFIAFEFPRENDGDLSKKVVFAWEDGEEIYLQSASYSKGRAQWGITDQSRLNKKHFMNGVQKGAREIRVQPLMERDGIPQADFASAACLLDFLNALACSNVHIERSEPRKAGKKIKAALPFDTYYVLTIDVPGKAGDGAATGGHRSPREHLRRGHIRRLADGRRIWVNATVVAAGRGAGVVTKDYAVRCAA